MMLLLYKFLITIIGLIIYKLKPNWLMLYWFFFFPIFFPFCANYFNIYETDQFREALNITQGSLCNLSLLIIVYEIIINHKRFDMCRVKIPFIVLAVYLVLHNTLFHFSISTIINDIRLLLVSIAPVCLMYISPQVIPKMKVAFISTVLVLLIQFVWCILELNGIYPFAYFYLGHSAIGENLVAGTFHRFNALGNFLTTIYLIVSFEFFLYNKVKMSIYIFCSLLILSMVVMSGAKMSILISAYIIIVCSILFGSIKQKVGLLIILAFLVFIFSDIFNFLLDSEGFNRINEGLTNFANKGKGEENTMSLSFYLVEKYFYQSPFIGNGLSWKGESAYGTLYDLTFFKADARMAYMIVEYGLIGFFLYIYYYITIILDFSKYPNISRQILFITIIYLLIMTITEGGLFDINVLLPIFIYFYILINRDYYDKEING